MFANLKSGLRFGVVTKALRDAVVPAVLANAAGWRAVGITSLLLSKF